MADLGACILSIGGQELTDAERALFAEYRPWGVILMGRSCGSRNQVRRLVDEIWQAMGRACLVFIDQEGGRVARLKPPEWPVFPAAAAYAELYSDDPSRALEAVWLGHRLIAHELASMQIHADCAPVLDLPVPGAHDIIGDRAFGETPDQAAALGRAALEGLAAGGVAGVIKHIPGHGRARADSHAELPRVTDGDNVLAKDFDAFAKLADAPMAMTAHILYEAIDPDRAATVSPVLISDIIRKRIGFDGLLMSDDLGMKALGGGLDERAGAAIAAGCDVVLHCSGFLKDPDEIFAEMQTVAEAAPKLEGEALRRAERAEAMAPEAQPFDIEAGWARFRKMFPATGAIA